MNPPDQNQLYLLRQQRIHQHVPPVERKYKALDWYHGDDETCDEDNCWNCHA